MTAENPKVCGCGESYDAEAWRRLDMVGVQPDEEQLLELRNCRACGSTLAELVERIEEAG